MTRKKQQKNKKPNSAGVFISSLLSSASSAKPSESKKSKHKHETETETKTGEKAVEDVSVDISKLQSVVLFRTLLELALVNIALGSAAPDCPRRKTMSPPSASSGLSKLMSPVQDLGKSLLGFLVGSPAQSAESQTTGETTVPMTPGRQRPLGHPAHPGVNATPIVIRRSKVDRSQTMSKSLEKETPPTPLQSSLVKEEPERPEETEKPPAPPVPAKPRSVSRSRRRKNKKCQQKQDQADQDTGNRKVSLSSDPLDAPQVGPQSEISSQAEETRQATGISEPSEETNPANEDLSPEVSNTTGFVTARNSLVVKPDQEKDQDSFSALDVSEENCEVRSGHTKTSPGEDEKEFNRKEVFDIKDESDKNNREVVEKSSQLSSDIPGESSPSVTESECRVPPAPPLPPPGFLLDGLKSDPCKPDEKACAVRSVGAVKNNKQLSRKDLLIDQLTSSGAEDPFTLFLRTQLNICQDPRERTGGDHQPPSETLRRKKERRKAAESGEKSEEQSDNIQTPGPPALPDIGENTSKENQEEGRSKSVKQKGLETRVKTSCQNARDRPISIIDIEEINTTNSPVLNNTPDTPEADSVITPEVDSSSRLEKASSEPEGDSVVVDKREAGVAMIVEEPSAETENNMGAGQSSTLLHQNLYSKQNLSKSDSGYSGQEDIEDVDNEDTSPAHQKLELTVDEAHRKYDRIVEQKPPPVLPPQKSRNRVLSEGSEFSEDFSEDDDVDGEELCCVVRPGRSWMSMLAGRFLAAVNSAVGLVWDKSEEIQFLNLQRCTNISWPFPY